MTTANIRQSKSMVSFPGAIKLGFRRYVDFRGRSTRAEFWWWMLFVLFVRIVSEIVYSLFTAIPFADTVPFSLIFTLLTLIPSVAVTARRLHDIGKSGWWQMAWVGVVFGVFIVGLIVTISLAFAFVDSDTLPPGEHLIMSLYSLVGPAGLPAMIALVITSVAVLAVWVWPIAWLARQGQPGPNRFGTDPRAPESP